MKRQHSPSPEAAECDGCGVFLPPGRTTCEGCAYQRATNYPGLRDPHWLIVARDIQANPGTTHLDVTRRTGIPSPHRRVADAKREGWTFRSEKGDEGLWKHWATPPAEVDRASYPDNPLLRPTSGAEAPTAGAEGAAHLDERPPEPLPENSDQLLAEALSKLQRTDLADKIRAAA